MVAYPTYIVYTCKGRVNYKTSVKQRVIVAASRERMRRKETRKRPRGGAVHVEAELAGRTNPVLVEVTSAEQEQRYLVLLLVRAVLREETNRGRDQMMRRGSE